MFGFHFYDCVDILPHTGTIWPAKQNHIKHYQENPHQTHVTRLHISPVSAPLYRSGAEFSICYSDIILFAMVPKQTHRTGDKRERKKCECKRQTDLKTRGSWGSWSQNRDVPVYGSLLQEDALWRCLSGSVKIHLVNVSHERIRQAYFSLIFQASNASRRTPLKNQALK